MAQRVMEDWSDVLLQQPKARRVRGGSTRGRHPSIPRSTPSTRHPRPTARTACGCEAFLKKAGLRQDATFKAALQAFINAVPRTRLKGKFVRPEAAALDALRAAFFEDLEVPAEEVEVAETMVQGRLL